MIWIAAALLLAGLGFVLVVLFQDESDNTQPDDVITREKNGKAPAAIVEYLAENGVELPALIVNASLALIVASIALSFILLPLKLAAMAFVGILATAILLVKVTGNNRRAKMLEQLPSFINQVTRRLSAGTSVENAFADSVETLEAPLGTVMRRVVRRVHLGFDLHQAFEREARMNKINEFDMLATALRINEQYGGSIRNILDDIVDILRMQDSGRRELAAMTGETRFTALVLALMPPGIAAYTFADNPEFLTNMWNNAGGQQMLFLAVGMQVTGVLILWRMVKAIG
ncbi:type II secretion system F family protein [Spongiibacter sp. KMU-158]|uniref:Type II secretion system F family protein n=1 Tax=Spongiibacter pelagi TaxID=2760804 RepID=A0A927C2V7_9GAMM|nr:type II secretion system F family protein [Spongiibacter pelagi]MBD2858475.1 type II secretion system F family protein [Spongiibacter pelagi]